MGDGSAHTKKASGLTIQANVALSLPEGVLCCTNVGAKILGLEVPEGELHGGGVTLPDLLSLLSGGVDQQLVVKSPEMDSVGEGCHLALEGDRGVDWGADQLVGYGDHGMDCRTEKVTRQEYYVEMNFYIYINKRKCRLSVCLSVCMSVCRRIARKPSVKT